MTKEIRFKFDGIPIRHVVTPHDHYLLLLVKDYKGQYTELALLTSNYYPINVYYLDVISKCEYSTIRLEDSISRDIREYERIGRMVDTERFIC